MYNLNDFRKPYVACLLAILLMCISCKDTEITNDETYDITKFMKKHLDISSELSTLIQNETNINYDMFLDMSTSVTESEFESTLKHASFNNSEKLSFLIHELHINVQEFLKINPNFLTLNEEQIRDLLETEFNLLSLNKSLAQKTNPCADRRATAKFRCERNWTISMGTIIILAMASGGTAYIASTVATGIFANCMREAQNDYEACMKE